MANNDLPRADQIAVKKFPGAFKRQIEGHPAIVLAGQFETRDLERADDGAEIRNNHLPAPDRAVEHEAANESVEVRILEYSGPGDARVPDAGAFQQFAPVAGGFLAACVTIDALGVESDRARPQPATVT